MTDSENINLKGASDGNSGEHLKKAQQQLVQKDNLIRLLQAQLKKQKETGGEGGEQSAILSNLEGEIKKLNEEISARDSEVMALKRANEESEQSRSELKKEISALKKQNEILSETQSKMASSTEVQAIDGGLVESLRLEIVKLEDVIKAETEELNDLKFKLENELETSAKLKEELRSNEIRLKHAELSEGGAAEVHGTASKILEKHIKGGKYLPEESAKMLDLLNGISHDMSRTIDDKQKENEKLLDKLRKFEEGDTKITAFVEENEKLKEKINYLKTVSDSHVKENYSDFKILVSHVIQIIDDFQAAYVLFNNGDVSNFKLKVDSVYEMLKTALKTVRVHPIATIGEKYNTRLHEVVEYVRSKDHDDDTVVDEVMKGYTLEDEILRQARVKVIKNRFKCGSCGNISRVGSQFCDSCGSKLETLMIPYKDIKNTGSLYYQTGKVFEEKNMLDKAREYYQQAVALEPLNPQYLYTLAKILERLGEYQNAVSCFRKISDTDPHYEEVGHYIKNIEMKINIIEGIKNITPYK